MSRQALIAKVHLGAKELGLDEDTRRDLMERVTGHRSAKDCSDELLVKVLGEYKARGWTPKVVAGGRQGQVATARRPASSPMANKARAMWISLHQLGVVNNRSETALEAFAKRQLGVERMDFANQGQAYKLIEALKAMAVRAGWSQDGSVDQIKARLAALIEARG